VWKGADGIPHAISASCTHKGCTVTWNNADRTWDCPCHGSIFAIEGSVIHGPAMEPFLRRSFTSWFSTHKRNAMGMMIVRHKVKGLWPVASHV
jgi:Rieske Fe-S protein